MTKDVFPKLANKETSSALNKFKRKISGKGVAIAGKHFPYSSQMKMWIILLNCRVTRKIRFTIDGKKTFLDLAVPLAKDKLPKSGTKVTSSVIDKFERKISGKDV